jgi:hypothetical protein
VPALVLCGYLSRATSISYMMGRPRLIYACEHRHLRPTSLTWPTY